MSTGPIEAINAIASAATPEVTMLQRPLTAPTENVSFAEMMFDGIAEVSRKVTESEAMVQSFILNDSIPPHRVMYALSQSHMSLQLMLQVRNRLVEGYQDIMRMQL